ncbi:MAG: type III secretion system outer membrane ring subunit SctC, partial [Victivallales bacterium]|nr:type III secretion system outer membrane ring subunit SctC [Victivallales bacterium]
MNNGTFLKVALVSLLCMLGAAFSQEAKVKPSMIPWKTGEYTLIAREMSLVDALNSFGTSQGLSVVMSKNVVGVLSGDFRNLAPQDFLEKVATLHSLAWYYDGTALYIYASSEIETLLVDLQYMKAGEVREMLRELGVEDERFPLKTTSNDELVMVAGPPRYVMLVAELIEKADKLREKRTYSEIETRIFPLKHTWADDVTLGGGGGGEASPSIKGVAKMLEDIMKIGETKAQDKAQKNGENKGDNVLEEAMDRTFQPIIKAENRLNAVVVRDVVTRMPVYEKLIAELDVPQKLVEIAVTTLELSKNDALDWQLSLSVKGATGNMEGAAGQNVDNLFSPEELIGKGLSGAMAYIGKHVTVDASLATLRQKGKARGISRTSILTMNNMSATISDTQSYHARVVGTEVASLEEVKAGMTLNVKPRIVFPAVKDAPAQFWMTVSLSDGGFESISVDAMPLTRESSVQTQAAVNEGDCILLAGYLKDIEEEAHWGIPYLRDIPYIGWLFGGISKKKETVQRMFILTPYLVDIDTAELARVQATRQRNITREEELEDDKKEDDVEREKRDLERKNRDEKRHEQAKDDLERRKAELKLEKKKRQADRDEKRKEWKEDIKEQNKDWEEEQKEQKELKKKWEKYYSDPKNLQKETQKQSGAGASTEMDSNPPSDSETVIQNWAGASFT